MSSYIFKQIDAIIYLIIVPFTILYLFPNFFVELNQKLSLPIYQSIAADTIGIVFMNLGALLAVWATVVLHINKKASVSPFSKPEKVIAKGPFSIVRHPMMWSINLVIIGQIFVYGAPLLLVWFGMWLRFAYLYIARYEEPYLISIFGKEYEVYCQKVPRWFPKR